jgi:hypothetical protein
MSDSEMEFLTKTRMSADMISPDLRLSVSEIQNPFQVINRDIEIQLENFSEDYFLFDPNKDIFIYSYDADQNSWIEVENSAYYKPSVIVELPHTTSSESYDSGVTPKLEGFNLPIELRIVVSGYFCPDDKFVNSSDDVPQPMCLIEMTEGQKAAVYADILFPLEK